MDRLRGKLALVTGGGSGLGEAICRRFSEESAEVIVNDLRADAAGRVAADVGGHALAFDVADSTAVARAVAELGSRFGRLDVLVNNAGTFEERDYAAGKNPNATLDAEVALNLSAPIHLTGEVLERWPEPDAIVFITSGFALVSPTRAPTHGAVKAGLHGFADGLRRQLAPQGTHVLEVLPPSTDTPMNAAATGKKLTPAQVAAVTMKALRRRRNMAFPGQTKVMPAMLRIAPGTLRRVVAEL